MLTRFCLNIDLKSRLHVFLDILLNHCDYIHGGHWNILWQNFVLDCLLDWLCLHSQYWNLHSVLQHQYQKKGIHLHFYKLNAEFDIKDDSYGKWKLNLLGLRTMFRIVKSVLTEEGREVWRNNFRVSKIILITLVQLLNWGFFIYGAVTRPSNDKFHQHFIAASNLVLPRCLILPSLHLYCQSSSLHFILHQHEVLQRRENTSFNVLLHCSGSVVLDSRSDFDASSSNYKSSQCRSLLLQQSSEQF